MRPPAAIAEPLAVYGVALRQGLTRIGAPGEARTLLSHTTILLAARVLASVLTLVSMLLLARVADPADLGIAMAGLSFAFLISVAASLNVEAGAIRYLVAYLAEGETEKAAGFVAFSLETLALVSPFLIALAIAAACLQAPHDVTLVFLLSLLTAPVMALTRICGRHATALDAVLEGALPRLLVRPVLFSLVAGLAFATGTAVSAGFVMALFLAAAVLTALLQLVLLRRHLGFAARAERDASERGRWLATGMMLTPMLVMSEFMNDLVIAAAALVMAGEEVARLAIAFALLNLLNFGLTSVNMAVSPALARALLSGDRARAERLLAAVGGLKLLGLLVGGAGILVLREPILGLFGPHYVAASETFFILFAMPLVHTLFGPSVLVLNILGERRALLVGCTAGALAIAVLTPLGAMAYGVEGAAAGAAIAFLMQQVLLFVFVRARTGVDPSLLVLGAGARILSGPLRTPPLAGEHR